jgi:phosphatidylglycerophosphate synthase
MLDDRRSARRRAPLLLSALRIVLAPLFVLAIGRAPAWALPVALLAAATDFADGRLARRLGVASRAGAVLDVVADGIFVVAALTALAATGLVSWLLPVAVALALAGFALAAARTGSAAEAAAGGIARARGPADRAGHSAGIVNYGIVLAASGVLAFAWPASWLVPASVAVAVLNLSPLLLRVGRRTRPPESAL